MWPVLGIVAVYARELLLARIFWCQNFRILEQLIFGWRRSMVSIAGRLDPLSGMAEARRHSRSPETQPRPPGREAPGSGSGPDGRRQRARRIGPVWQPSVAAAAADDEGFEIDDGMGALRRRGRRGRRANRAARAAARARASARAARSASRRIASHRIASLATHRIASHRIASHRIASHRIASHRIAINTLHRIASHRIASHRIASHRNIASHRIASHRIASHRIASHCTASLFVCVSKQAIKKTTCKHLGFCEHTGLCLYKQVIF